MQINYVDRFLVLVAQKRMLSKKVNDSLVNTSITICERKKITKNILLLDKKITEMQNYLNESVYETDYLNELSSPLDL